MAATPAVGLDHPTIVPTNHDDPRPDEERPASPADES